MGITPASPLTGPAVATLPGGGEPSDVKSVFCCARFLACGVRRARGMYTGTFH